MNLIAKVLDFYRKSYCSFLLLAQKKRTKEKGSLKSFLGFNILSTAHAIQLVVPHCVTPQTVLLTGATRFAANKMQIFFKKRFTWHNSPYGDLDSLCTL